MSDALNRYIEAASGLTKVTRETAEKIVKGLVEQGQAATRNPQELVEGLLERSQDNRRAIVSLVRGESKRVVQRMGLATQGDVDRLERQVADLRRRLREAESAPAKKSAKKTAKKSSKKSSKKSKKSTKKSSS